MQLNRNYISTKNTYSGITPEWIVIHNTDNEAPSATALAHAQAQYNGNFQNMSCHFYVDDSDIAYQTADYSHGCWHVGVNYGGRLFGICSNRNSIGIEMCVQRGYHYEKAFQNTVDLCRQVMKESGIDSSHVVSHFDVCAKNCPSAIRAKGDWNRFKELILEGSGQDAYYRIRKSWLQEDSQTGAYLQLEKAKAACSTGYSVFDSQGRIVYSNPEIQTPFKIRVSISNLRIRSGAGLSFVSKGFCPIGTYTITAVVDADDHSWGQLKSKAGWIALEYVQRLENG